VCWTSASSYNAPFAYMLTALVRYMTGFSDSTVCNTGRKQPARSKLLK
jgi:hypothetical protein